MKRNLRLAAAAVAAQNAAQDGRLRINLASYQRGLFVSTAISEIEIALPARLTGGDGDRRWLRLPIRHEIKHGPLIIGRLPGQGWRREPLLAVVHSTLDPRALGAGGEQWQMSADTLITLQGDVLSTFALAPLKRPAGPEAPGISGRIKSKRKPAGLEAELRITDLEWRQGERNYRLQGLELNISTGAEANGRLAGELNGRLKAASAGGEKYGPGEITAAWRNLPWEASRRLIILAPRAGEEISGRTAQTLVETLPEFIAGGTEITVKKLRLTTPAGEISGRLGLAFKGREKPALFHPLALLSALRLELSLAGPESLALALAQDRRQLLDALIERGYLLRQEGQLRLNLSYREGSLILNNNPLPLQELLPFGRL